MDPAVYEEVQMLMYCISMQRVINTTSFTNLVVCIYNVLEGSDEAYQLLKDLLVEVAVDLEIDGDSSDVVPPNDKDLEELWAKAKAIEPEMRMPFDLEQLHAWACSDDPERYNYLAEREKRAKTSASLIFG